MLQKIKSGLLIVLSVIVLMPAVSAFAVTPKQQALSAYSRWLSGAKVQVMPKGFKAFDDAVIEAVPASKTEFAIAYINNDSIPELIVRTSDKHFFSILTFKNGKIVRVFYEDDMYNTVKGYYSKTGMFVDTRTGGFHINKEFYYLMGTAGVTRRFENSFFKDTGEKYYDYYSKNNNVRPVRLKNHTEFKNKLLTFTKGKALTPVRFYKDTAANRKNVLK